MPAIGANDTAHLDITVNVSDSNALCAWEITDLQKCVSHPRHLSRAVSNSSVLSHLGWRRSYSLFRRRKGRYNLCSEMEERGIDMPCDGNEYSCQSGGSDISLWMQQMRPKNNDAVSFQRHLFGSVTNSALIPNSRLVLKQSGRDRSALRLESTSSTILSPPTAEQVQRLGWGRADRTVSIVLHHPAPQHNFLQRARWDCHRR